VCAGSLAEVFGSADRAVARIERNGAEVEELLLLRLRHGLYALVNRCPHRARQLDDGRVRGNVLQCRGHGRSFSVRTGRSVGTLSLGGPPKLHRIPVWAEGDRLFLDLTTLI
jgi:nitrite reductase/ring-hydroxylating ferredoxin subunit